MFYKEITGSRANEVAWRFGFLSTLFHNYLRKIIMYQIKIEHQCTSRWYKAENHWDAIELFDMLTKTCRFVQLWQGMNLLSEYRN